MKKADRGARGIDGTLPNGRTLQVKSKKAGAHSDSGTYIGLSKAPLESADDLLIVFVDYDTCEYIRHLGPVSMTKVKPLNRNRRYYISDILKIKAET